MTTVAVELLTNYLKEIGSTRKDTERSAAPQWIFPWFNGDFSDKNLQRVTSLLSRQFARIFAAAQCVDLRFHDLRHEATSRLYERTTLTDLQIAKITGHKTISMLARYANLRGSELALKLS
jgi:integrase